MAVWLEGKCKLKAGRGKVNLMLVMTFTAQLRLVVGRDGVYDVNFGIYVGMFEI